ncbi:Hypothetical_protein [Hexamita inflata]|uniref:Hypothetical_protein n=1 Tax=Hexamita inflata TaxID=28002 RepID=A0AA86UAX4_9EUKA|nr:Hypothetical protein HINF_LOCUS35969 [Hexamita inflata]
MILIFSYQIQELCSTGFVLQNQSCVCHFKLSSNSSKCVLACSEANEIEIKGKCVQISKKTANIFSECVKTAECQTGAICADNACYCDVANGYVVQIIQAQPDDYVICSSCQDRYGPGVKFDAYANSYAKHRSSIVF